MGLVWKEGGIQFFIYVQSYAGGWLEFQIFGPCSAWRAGHLDHAILLVRPKTTINESCLYL